MPTVGITRYRLEAGRHVRADGSVVEAGDLFDPTETERRQNSERLSETVVQVEASSAALELADDHDVDLGQVQGTGKNGKIIKSDVEDAVEED